MWWIRVATVLVIVVVTNPSAGSAQSFPGCDYFRIQEQAQAALDNSEDDAVVLDEDGDGIACPDLPSAGSNPAMPELPPDGDYDCTDFAYQEMAQAVLDEESGDPHNLDPNQDGFACALLPRQSELAGDSEDTATGTSSERTARQQPAQTTESPAGGARRSSDPGSRDDPLPVGTTADVGGGWFVSVVDVDFDATDVILDENMFNEPPEPGQQYVLITISATYEGPDSSDVLLAGNMFHLVGESDVAYESFDPGCGVTPNDFPTTEVFAGGTLTGTVCFAVEAADVPSLVMYSEELFSFDSDDRVWFALR